MRQDPIPVVVSFPLTERTRATIEGASPLVQILDYPTEQIAPGAFRPPPTDEQVRMLAEAEVLFGSHLDPIEVHDAAPNLKWLQVLTAGLDELIAQGILERDFAITTMSGVGAVPIAEYCMGVMVMLEKGSARNDAGPGGAPLEFPLRRAAQGPDVRDRGAGRDRAGAGATGAGLWDARRGDAAQRAAGRLRP